MQFVLKYIITALLVTILWAIVIRSSSNETNISIKVTNLNVNNKNNRIFTISEIVNCEGLKNTNRRNNKNIESKVWMFNQNIFLSY
jgi:hypothetical protein